MIIHSPIISGSLTFAEGGTFTLPDNGVYSGSFSGSYQGDGSNLTFGGTGIISGAEQLQADFLDTLGDGVVSGSSQITITDTTGFSTFSSSLKTTDDTQDSRLSDLESFSSSLDSGFVTEGELSSLSSSVDSTINSLTTDDISEGTNLYYTDARVKTKLDVETVISGSSQVDAASVTNFDSEVKTKLDTDSVVSGSSQVSYVGLSNIPANIVSGSSQVSYVGLSNIPGGIVSGSSQVDAASVTNFDSEVKTKLDTDAVVSGSSQIDLGSVSNNTTTNVSEGTNLYYTDTRVKTKLDTEGVISGSSQVSLSTTDVSEGTNLYYTDTRVKTKLDTETVVSGSGQILSLVSIDEDAMTTNSDTKLPTQQSVKAYVDAQVAGIVDSAPGALDTLNELAAALGDDSNFSTTISNQIAGKVSQSLEIVSGNGLTGGGNLTTNRTLAVGQGSGISVTADAVAVDGTVLRTTGFGVVSGSSQVSHDSTTGFVANEHIDHSSVSISAGTGLTGGGNLTTTRTLSLSHLGIQSLTDPNADRILFWDDSAGATAWLATGTGISISGTTISNSGVTSAVAGTGVSVSGATGAVTFSIGQAVGTSSTVRFGKVGIGTDSDATYELKVSGDIGATGDIVAYISSDERLKDNITLIENPIQKVKELKGVTWEWNENASEAAKQSPNVGVIAQDVEKVLPQLVHDRENGYKGVDYSKLTGLLIEVVKEQQERIEKLEERLNNLEN